MTLEELVELRDALVRESTQIHARARTEHRDLNPREQMRDQEIDDQLAEIKKNVAALKKNGPVTALDLRLAAANDNVQIRVPRPAR